MQIKSCRHVFFSDIIKTIVEIQVTSILEDIFNMASLVPRIAQVPTVAQGHHVGHQHQDQLDHQGGAATYLESAQQHLELREMREELTTRLTLVIEQVV